MEVEQMNFVTHVILQYNYIIWSNKSQMVMIIIKVSCVEAYEKI